MMRRNEPTPAEHPAESVSAAEPDEFLTPEALAALQRERVAALLREVRATNPFYRRKLADCDINPAAPDIAGLPFTTREEIQQDQIDHPPFGTNLTYPIESYSRMHQTSGSRGVPLRWLDTPASWEWWKRCWGAIYRAAGVHPRDRLVFPFSFGPFIGFWSAFESAAARGNLCLAAGGMTTPARLRYMLDTGATIVCCTPTYALHMAQVAADEKIDLPRCPVRALIVAGEPGGGIPATRARIESAWGARVFDHAGMTEVGAWGFEAVDASGMFVLETEFVAESIDPHTLRPVSDGEVGELVLTNLGRAGSPLLRYRTGDLVRLERGACVGGRWLARAAGGVLGRVDDMLIIRGNNVFPSAIEGILRERAEIAEFRLVVEERSGLSELAIEIEPAAAVAPAGLDNAALATWVTSVIRDRLNLRPLVRILPPGALPRFEMKARRVVRR